MSEIILRVTATKIVNKGGGVMRRIDRKKGEAQEKTDRGSDYVVFNCPHPKCGHRNKQSMYEADAYVPANTAAIPFRCRMCRRLIEVDPPTSTRTTPLLVTPAEFTQEMAQRRRDLAAHRPAR